MAKVNLFGYTLSELELLQYLLIIISILIIVLIIFVNDHNAVIKIMTFISLYLLIVWNLKNMFTVKAKEGFEEYDLNSQPIKEKKMAENDRLNTLFNRETDEVVHSTVGVVPNDLSMEDKEMINELSNKCARKQCIPKIDISRPNFMPTKTKYVRGNPAYSTTYSTQMDNRGTYFDNKRQLFGEETNEANNYPTSWLENYRYDTHQMDDKINNRVVNDM
jgi:hypothetical protein